jgi:hypothetical protein
LPRGGEGIVVRRSPKQIGTEGETMVARYLSRWFPQVTRLALAGANDLGDLGGVPGLTIQVKMGREMRLAEWVDQAEEQHARAGTTAFVVVHRRRGRGDPGKWYCCLPLEVFAPMYAALLQVGEAA